MTPPLKILTTRVSVLMMLFFWIIKSKNNMNKISPQVSKMIRIQISKVFGSKQIQAINFIKDGKFYLMEKMLKDG